MFSLLFAVFAGATSACICNDRVPRRILITPDYQHALAKPSQVAHIRHHIAALQDLAVAQSRQVFDSPATKIRVAAGILEGTLCAFFPSTQLAVNVDSRRACPSCSLKVGIGITSGTAIAPTPLDIRRRKQAIMQHMKFNGLFSINESLPDPHFTKVVISDSKWQLVRFHDWLLEGAPNRTDLIVRFVLINHLEGIVKLLKSKASPSPGRLFGTLLYYHLPTVVQAIKPLQLDIMPTFSITSIDGGDYFYLVGDQRLGKHLVFDLLLLTQSNEIVLPLDADFTASFDDVSFVSVLQNFFSHKSLAPANDAEWKRLAANYILTHAINSYSGRPANLHYLLEYYNRDAKALMIDVLKGYADGYRAANKDDSLKSAIATIRTLEK